MHDNFMSTQIFQDELEAIAAEAQFALGIDSGNAPFTQEQAFHVGEGGATSSYYQGTKLIGVSFRMREQGNRTVLFCADIRQTDYEPKGADLLVRMALGCLEELEPTAMSRKRRSVRNFNEHAERETQLSAARVSLDRALDILVAATQAEERRK